MFSLAPTNPGLKLFICHERSLVITVFIKNKMWGVFVLKEELISHIFVVGEEAGAEQQRWLLFVKREIIEYPQAAQLKLCYLRVETCQSYCVLYPLHVLRQPL